MISVTTETTLTGPVQHCMTSDAVLAVAVYEQALRFGAEPESSRKDDGRHVVSFLADAQTTRLIVQEARKQALHETRPRRKPPLAPQSGPKVSRHAFDSKNLKRVNALYNRAAERGLDTFVREAHGRHVHFEVWCTRREWRALKLLVRRGARR